MCNGIMDAFLLRNRRKLINGFHDRYGHDRMKMEALWDLFAGYMPLINVPVAMNKLFGRIKERGLELSLEKVKASLERVYEGVKKVKA